MKCKRCGGRGQVTNSWCVSRGHDPRWATLSECRWLGMGSVGPATVSEHTGGTPKPGHEACEVVHQVCQGCNGIGEWKLWV